MVSSTGFDPGTASCEVRRTNLPSHLRMYRRILPHHGGGDRTRTCDLLLAKQELYQLSYAPRTLELMSWWAYVDSNHRPYAYQAYALTT